MFISKIFSKLNSSKLLQNPRYGFFFSKPTPELVFNSQIKENLVHDQKYMQYMKTLNSSIPIEIGREFHKEKKPVNIFSQSAYLSIMASEEFQEWADLFKMFYRALETGNLAIIEGRVEKRLYEKVEKFHRDLAGTKLSLEIPSIQKPEFKVHIYQHKTFQGVFIDRELNLPLTNYYHKSTKNTETFEVLQEKALGREKAALKVNWEDLLDREISKEHLEKDRMNYSINQFILEVETNVKMFIAKEEKGETKPVYGNLEEGYESHFMIIENKRDYFKNFPYYIVDFDFALHKNPHVLGK